MVLKCFHVTPQNFTTHQVNTGPALPGMAGPFLSLPYIFLKNNTKVSHYDETISLKTQIVLPLIRVSNTEADLGKPCTYKG